MGFIDALCSRNDYLNSQPTVWTVCDLNTSPMGHSNLLNDQQTQAVTLPSDIFIAKHIMRGTI